MTMTRQMHSAAMRVRHAMAFATHKFFNDRGFLYIHTPIVTGADCEGAGEQFAVSTLLPDAGGEGENGHGGEGPPMTPAGAVDYSKVGFFFFLRGLEKEVMHLTYYTRRV